MRGRTAALIFNAMDDKLQIGESIRNTDAVLMILSITESTFPSYDNLFSIYADFSTV